MIKILNLKLMILLEYQNAKTFLKRAALQISCKKILRLNGLKTCAVILVEKRLPEFSKKNNCRKQIQNSLELKK